MKKAIILDLDNTIYPVFSIGDELFTPVYELLDNSDVGDASAIKKDMTRIPFQKIAEMHKLPADIVGKGLDILRELHYDQPMTAFEDFEHIKTLPQKKYMVTVGFTKMQQSKVERLNLAEVFDEIYIIDPENSSQSKKDVFAEILTKYNFKATEVIVVGDDPESEIKGAEELGIDALLYDKYETINNSSASPVISNFAELEKYLK